MIKKCDHPGCTKAGTCRAPKNRDLKDYWFFCQEHAAEYNKNWNYYANMSPEEIEEDWERQTFGSSSTSKSESDAQDYAKFINDFLTGRSAFDKVQKPSKLPSKIISALKVFDLPITASWREVSAKYRSLAKKHHPDTATNKENAVKEFTKISQAYETLKSYFNKK